MFMVLNLFVISVHGADTEDGAFDLSDYQASISNKNDYCRIQKGTYVHHKQEHILNTHHHGKKMKLAKHKTIHIYTTPVFEIQYASDYYHIRHTPSLPSVYRYLYFKEINPPPPKPC